MKFQWVFLHSTHRCWRSDISNVTNNNTYLACVCMSVWLSGHLHNRYRCWNGAIYIYCFTCFHGGLQVSVFKCKWTALKQNTGVNKDAFRKMQWELLFTAIWTILPSSCLDSTSEFYSSACFNTELTLNNLQQLVWQTFHMWALETEHNCLRMSSMLTALFLIKFSGGSVYILNYDIRSGWHFQWHLALIVIATERISF